MVPELEPVALVSARRLFGGALVGAQVADEIDVSAEDAEGAVEGRQVVDEVGRVCDQHGVGMQEGGGPGGALDVVDPAEAQTTLLGVEASDGG